MSANSPTVSIVYSDARDVGGVDGAPVPDIFVDANLDQIVAAVCQTRPAYAIADYFSKPLHAESEIAYRHAAIRDLMRPAIGQAAAAFATALQAVRAKQRQADALHYPYQKDWWFTAAAADYCDAVRTFRDALVAADPDSESFLRAADYLGGYVASDPFETMRTQVTGALAGLDRVAYSIRIRGATVTVDDFHDERDYSAEVLATFDRFRQGEAKSHLVEFRDYLDMNHVETQIADRVALLNPEAFAALHAAAAAYRDCVDPTVANIERETQFYQAYLEFMEPIRAAGLPVTIPSVSVTDKAIGASDTFDLALAALRVGQHREVVTNSWSLSGDERVIVVSGPNQGGKTTFARTFAQLHHLAALGLPVPGRDVRLFLPDRIFTHFERGENLTDHRSKLEDELIRIHRILQQATDSSVIVINEIFSSTTLDDAVFLGMRVVNAIIDLDCLCVCVTFIDELATAGDSVVSMLSTVVPDNPAERTFKVVRHPADGLAYAAAIAEKYGLTYDRLAERIAS